jgi:YHS domain-containing protein
MRFLLVEVIGPLLLLLLVRSLLRSLFAGFGSRDRQPAKTPTPPAVPAGGELKRDPVCGTYVAQAGALVSTVKGQAIYFCSKECRDKYRAA